MRSWTTILVMSCLPVGEAAAATYTSARVLGAGSIKEAETILRTLAM